MTNHKKLISALVSAITIVSISSFVSSASTSANQAATILPTDTIFLTTLAPSEGDSNISSLYETYLLNLLSNGIASDITSYSESTDGPVASFLENSIAASEISIGAFPMQSGIATLFFVVEMTSEDYSDLNSLIGEGLTAAETDTGYEMYYFDPSSDEDRMIPSSPSAYFTYQDGYLVIVEDYQEGLEELLTSESTLSSNSYYQEVENEFLSGDLWNLYIDMNYVFDTYLAEEEELEIADAIGAYGMSIKQTSNGFKMQTYSSNDENILSALGIDYSDTNAVPDIYNFMPSQNPIFYSEMFNLAKTWNTLESSSSLIESDLSDFDSALESETSISLDSDILGILDQGIGMLIQDSGETFPTMTIMADVTNTKAKAEVTVDKLVDYIWGLTEAEGDTFTAAEGEMEVEITKSEEEMLGGTATTFHIDISQKQSENPYAIYMPENYFDIDITIGITEDDILMVSTNSDIEEDYNQGLLTDDTFDEMFTDTQALATNISYFNIGNIGSYIKDLFDELEDAAGEEVSDFQSAKDSIDDFMSLFDAMFVSSLSTNDYSSSDTEIRLDLAGLMDIEAYFDKADTEVSGSYEVFSNSHKEFEDVEVDEWYGDNVYYLTTEGVINGYPDGTFQPGNDITRAEFITILMKSLYEEGYFEDTCPSTWECASWGEFEDANYWEWYGNYIYTAKELGIVEGYGDNTFKPGDPITRAEAITMVSRALALAEKEDGISVRTSPLTYTDIEEGAWYYNPVWNANYYKIVNENGDMETFEPDRPINRAESSQIIKKLMDVVKAN